MLLKTAFREIKTSLGRYLAILAIIALGVGFFAGLRVTRTAMISTANHYLKDLAMFDDRILSTLGWTEEDVDAFRKLDGVSAAEGARSADVLCVGEDGSDMVLKAHSRDAAGEPPELTGGTAAGEGRRVRGGRMALR